MKKGNKYLIKKILMEEGQISNFWLIENKITIRASEYIRQLREEGMNIETVMNGKECIYKLDPSQKKKKQVVEYLDNGAVRISYI